MPEIDQLIVALKKADEAGDSQAAQAIAAAIKRQKMAAPTASPQAQAQAAERPYDPMNDYRSPMSPVSSGFKQGMTFGFGDEMGAGIRAGVMAPFSKRTFGEIYDTEVGKIRGEMAAETEGAPVREFMGTAAGSLIPSSNLAKGVTSAARNLPNWIKIAGLGGAEGALYGAGTAEESKLKSAAAGGAWGAVAGPVLAAAAKPLLSLGKNGVSLLTRKLTDTPRREAERRVSDALRNDSFGLQDMQRLGANSDLVLADMGENVAGLARGAAAKPGPFRTAAADTLHGRQSGQQGRLIRSMGANGSQAYKDSFDDWANSRITAARGKYAEAYAASLDASSPQMKALLAKPAMQDALKEAERKIANETGIKGGNVQRLDIAKRALDDKIAAAQREGAADEVRILRNIKSELVAEMDRQVPAYAEARNIFAGEAAVREAGNFGTELFKRSVSHDDARRLVADMTESERAAFQRGALRGLVEILETTPESRNAAQKLIESVSVRDKLRLLFTNEQDFARFVQQAADESQMSYTRNVVLGGSPTARIQEEAKELTSAGELIHDVATGNKFGLMSRFLRTLGYGDISRETSEELGKLLLTNPGQPTIQRIGRLASQPLPGPISRKTQALVGGLTGAGIGATAGRQDADMRRRQVQAEQLRRQGVN